jgi:pimeloyl-ACP methyl ester carboxylesterase
MPSTRKSIRSPIDAVRLVGEALYGENARQIAQLMVAGNAARRLRFFAVGLSTAGNNETVVGGNQPMVALWRRWLQGWQNPPYARHSPLVLINGLAEQAETWFFNVAAWRRSFDVHMPNLAVYEGTALHRRIAEGMPITVDYLVEQLHGYLTEYVQTPPYNLVANSMGGKVAVEFAVRYPEQVGRLVLLCPSGLAEKERLPIVEGVRRSDMETVVRTVFHNPRRAPASLAAYYVRQTKNRRWRTGFLRTVRGTMEHRVRDLLPQVTQPTLLVVGGEDRIVDPQQAIDAAHMLPQGKLVVLPRCGHAPQIEAPATINRMVEEFLAHPLPKARGKRPILTSHQAMPLAK